VRFATGIAAALLLTALTNPVAGQPLTADAGFGGAGLEGCPTDLRYFNQVFGWQASWRRQWQSVGAASDDDVRNAIALWRTAPEALAANLRLLRRGPAVSTPAPRVVVERVLEQVDDLNRVLDAGAPTLSANVDPQLKAEWEGLFATSVRPALRAYRDYLLNEYLPGTTPAAGLSGVPGAAECFARSATYFTTKQMTPAQIESTGWRLLRETERELARLYRVPATSLPRLLDRLRQPQDANYGATELVDTSRRAIVRATAAMPRMFHGELRQPIEVQPMLPALQASGSAGYYQPAESGGPAAYVINLSRPGDRRLMAEVIAFHEALPGHHTRMALSLPAGDFNSGFAEGWAIYAEYLADEMGLYGSRLDRAGMIAKHLWAASRLVVEPGLHVHGWTRQQAVDFMRQHTALSDAEIAVEVDRYIATPGQSLSYMLGYDTIMSARRYAERRLGRRFDLRNFHDAVLGPGSRGLDTLQSDLVAWADAAARGPQQSHRAAGHEGRPRRHRG